MTKPSARYNVYRLIQDIYGRAGIADRLRTEPDAVFDEYALTAEEREVFKSGDPARLRDHGVDPIMVIPYLIHLAPDDMGFSSISAYSAVLDRLPPEHRSAEVRAPMP